MLKILDSGLTKPELDWIYSIGCWDIWKENGTKDSICLLFDQGNRKRTITQNLCRSWFMWFKLNSFFELRMNNFGKRRCYWARKNKSRLDYYYCSEMVGLAYMHNIDISSQFRYNFWIKSKWNRSIGSLKFSSFFILHFGFL